MSWRRSADAHSTSRIAIPHLLTSGSSTELSMKKEPIREGSNFKHDSTVAKLSFKT
jgi:hypothetical protein